MRTLFLWIAVFVLAASASAAGVDYRRDVKPILAGRCFACHSAVRQKGGLRLDAAALIRKGGRNGAAVVAGKSAASLLVDAVLARGRSRMPPEKEGEGLSRQQITTLETWIDQGARAPDEPVPADPREHWAFQPPKMLAVPPNAGHPVDAFLAAERERHGVKPNPPADRATLLRRVSLDLIGLPPTREEIHAFLADESPEAYEKVVDRLLGSPQYGERWGRHWMDIWRYSDPFGFAEEYRYSHRHIWRWRDWIIESLNADKGLDQMMVEMLAGDELRPADRNTLRATGYLARNWYKFNRNAWLQDTVEHTAAGFLGMTLRCCRCHDHKYDPLSQQEYYRFRAFFEPHDIRIDPIPGVPDVNKDGVARAFDAMPPAPTYLFVRGDDRSPDKSRVLPPGVPAVLGGDVVVKEVHFTTRDLAEALTPAIAEARRLATAEVEAASLAARQARDQVAEAQKVQADLAAGKPTKPTALPVFFKDHFSSKSDLWKPLSGQWLWQGGKLLQKENGHFATLVLQKNHPRDFMGRVRYRTTGGSITSVGFAFDVVGTTSWQAVYTHCNPGSSSVQAFHRTAGVETYPPEGSVPHPIKLNEEITLEFAVRGSLLNVWVNGQLKIVYKLPLARQAGSFALWNHQALAEFSEVHLAPLPATVSLVEKATEPRPSPFGGPTVLTQADADNGVHNAAEALARAEKRQAISQGELASVEARAAADRAECSEVAAAEKTSLAQAAGRAERQVAVLRAEEALLETEQGVKKARRGAATGDAAAKKALAAAELHLTMAKKTLSDAQAAAAKPDAMYTPLLQLKLPPSSGRRLALARWITSRDNPLTARVAVNHVWMRHFGKPLVPTVANFGLGGKPPTHPELLDWLAVRFMEDGWSMKKLHRLLVTSEAYRLSSQAAADNPNLAIDPENRWLWRMNTRRMEAEAVRDSVLAVAGSLDPAFGGPILDVTLGQTLHRRSVYFRFNTEYKILFVDQFDAPSPTECYERRESVVPQQALALCNSALALGQSRQLAARLAAERGDFLTSAFEQILGRLPSAAERSRCERFLRDQAELLAAPARLTPFPPSPDAVAPAAADPVQRARENLVHVLFNHNDFVTIR
jgi:hypothetical protein